MTKTRQDNEANRHEWVRRSLAELPSGWRILDAGAGEQRYRQDCEHLRYVTQDAAEYRPSDAVEGLHLPRWDYGKLDIVCDITAIPEPDGAFDAVLRTEVIEHVPDPIDALRELSRLLRPGGRLILSAPFGLPRQWCAPGTAIMLSCGALTIRRDVHFMNVAMPNAQRGVIFVSR